jgi:RND family efflux transporter MFP subunit
MKSIHSVGWTLSLAIVIMYSCNSEKMAEVKNKAAAAADTTEKVIPIRVEPIQEHEITRTLDYSANLIAFKEINFAPASPGRINNIHVDVGSRIQKGQLLVEMDKTQLIQAASQYETAKSTFQRVDTLHQMGSISEQQYEQTKTQYELAKSGYDFLSENTTLVSPINGLVTGKYFENGELYSGAPNTQAGKAAVLTLMQINPMKALVSISQSHFPDVRAGMKVEITTDIFPDKTFRGTVNKVYPTIDAATRTFKTEILIENVNEILRPGMYGDISISLNKVNALVVPSIAILKQEGTNNRYVFLHEEGKATKVAVEIGKRFDDKIEIIGEGIQEGAELIIEGQANLLDGSLVEVVQE